MNTELDTLRPERPLKFLTYGCGSLGANPDNFQDEVRVARSSMEHGLWFHASQEYSCAFWVIRQAFDEDPANKPPLIIKVRCDHAATIEFDVEDALSRLNVERVEIAQLCRSRMDHRRVVADFLNHGEMWQVCEKLKSQGKVGRFVLEVFSSFSSDALQGVENGLFPAYNTYLNLGQREMNNPLFDTINQKQVPIFSMRTVYGGNFDPERIKALRARDPKHEVIQKYDLLEPIFRESGCSDWVEFSFSFLKSFPNVLSTVSGTSKFQRLQELVKAEASARPLPSELSLKIQNLHRQWVNK
jgi:aryl-alcohol dehydrogenase-like predicted oxidoreductase